MSGLREVPVRGNSRYLQNSILIQARQNAYGHRSRSKRCSEQNKKQVDAYFLKRSALDLQPAAEGGKSRHDLPCGKYFKSVMKVLLPVSADVSELAMLNDDGSYDVSNDRR